MEYETLKNWKYRIRKSFSIQTNIKPTKTIRSTFSTLTPTGRLYINKGFCWDGATGGRDTKNIMRASCIHDGFCNFQQKGLLTVDQRKQADKLLYKLMKEDGMSEFRANIIYQAVRRYVEARY